MLTRAMLLVSLALSGPVAAQTLDPSTVQLNARGAEKFVRATQYAAPGGQRGLVSAWELAPYATGQWTSVCENAQRYLLKR